MPVNRPLSAPENSSTFYLFIFSHAHFNVVFLMHTYKITILFKFVSFCSFPLFFLSASYLFLRVSTVETWCKEEETKIKSQKTAYKHQTSWTACSSCLSAVSLFVHCYTRFVSFSMRFYWVLNVVAAVLNFLSHKTAIIWRRKHNIARERDRI